MGKSHLTWLTNYSCNTATLWNDIVMICSMYLMMYTFMIRDRKRNVSGRAIFGIWTGSPICREGFQKVKGIFRDHSRDNALNFHKIRDFCILVMVLDV